MAKAWRQEVCIQSSTVEPPITDTPRYEQPPYNGQAMCPRLTLP